MAHIGSARARWEVCENGSADWGFTGDGGRKCRNLLRIVCWAEPGEDEENGGLGREADGNGGKQE